MKVTKITLDIPGLKQYQGGDVEILLDEDADFVEVGALMARITDELQAGAKEYYRSGQAKAVADVLPAPQYDERDPESPGVTTPEEAEALIKSELGATTIDDIMNEDVDEEEAPYSAPVTPPSDDDWDF